MSAASGWCIAADGTPLRFVIDGGLDGDLRNFAREVVRAAGDVTTCALAVRELEHGSDAPEHALPGIRALLGLAECALMELDRREQVRRAS